MALHILVIDDQISLCRFIAMELDAAGYRVSISIGDIGTISMIRALEPDFVILGWELRNNSGREIYQQLSLDSESAPIAIVTAKDETSCQVALELGVPACLTKPFLMQDLLKAIEYHLQNKDKRAYVVFD